MTIEPLLPITYLGQVRAALLEDLGRAGDVTSVATIPAAQQARCHIAAREQGRIAGLDVAAAVFSEIDRDLNVRKLSGDGCPVAKGELLAVIEGSARSILTAERVALNYLGHLSGIASATAKFVAAVSGTKARIVCTRKTTPGLRGLEKYAVRCGGGVNHRFGLDDGILIKDNHIAIAGGVAQAIQAARQSTGHMMRIEVEVDSLRQFDEALGLGADAVLLDNMTPDDLREAVRRNQGRATLEASGGITLANVAAVAATGVNLISVGWITHSAPNLDVALDFEARL